MKRLHDDLQYFKERNHSLRKVGLWALVPTFVCCWLWWQFGKNPTAEHFDFLMSSYKDSTNYRHLLILSSVAMLFGTITRSYKFFLFFLFFALLSISKLTSPNIKLEKVIAYSSKNSSELKQAIRSNDVKALDELLDKHGLKIGIPTVTLDYLKAQMQVNNGLKGPYLERTVTALRQGDQTLSGYDAETLYVLEKAYDGQIVSEPAKSFYRRYIVFQWFLLPAIPMAVYWIIMFLLQHRQRSLTQKIQVY